MQDGIVQGGEAQYSLSTGKMGILSLSKMALWGQLLGRKDCVNYDTRYLLSVWLLLWQEWCKRLSKALQIHVFFFCFCFFFFWVGTCFIFTDGILCLISIKNNGIMLCSPKPKLLWPHYIGSFQCFHCWIRTWMWSYSVRDKGLFRVQASFFMLHKRK